MLDKKNEYTSFGQLLISAGIINLIPRIYLPLDIFISIIIVAKGAASIKNKSWVYDEFLNKLVLLIIFSYTILKGFIIYYLLPAYILKRTNQEITGSELLLASIVFLFLIILIVIIAYFNLIRILKCKNSKKNK